MKKTKLPSVLGSLALLLALASCHGLDHRVGSGPKGTSEVHQRQWYVLWGIVPLGKVDSKAMAAGAADYDVRSEQTFVDCVISFFTSIASFNCQTVTVKK